MRVIIVGSGGREHALAWRLAQDGAELFLAPGNGGSRDLGEVIDLPAPVDDAAIHPFVLKAKEIGAELVVVGPEAPLVAGLVDALEQAGIPAFGPRRGAAQLEGSKAYSKDLMRRCGIPTAEYRVFEDADAAEAFLDERQRSHPEEAPWVVKADGLAAGKGVVVPKDVAEAKEAVRRLMKDRVMGAAGDTLVLEERLVGQEVSYHVIADGTRYVALAPAQDHKRLLDGDQGPNTGGMGAYTPPPIVDDALQEEIHRTVIEPTLRGMAETGNPFRGALFVGLMIHEGQAKVLEFNVRFGDPECECLMMRLGGSLLDLLLGAARGDLSGYEPEWLAPAAMTVVLASDGYPGAYEKGRVIGGLADAAQIDDAEVFHAGTTEGHDGVQKTAGGRVLAVTARGTSIEDARERAYEAAGKIRFSGVQYRRDIGHHAV